MAPGKQDQHRPRAVDIKIMKHFCLHTIAEYGIPSAVYQRQLFGSTLIGGKRHSYSHQMFVKYRIVQDGKYFSDSNLFNFLPQVKVGGQGCSVQNVTLLSVLIPHARIPQTIGVFVHGAKMCTVSQYTGRISTKGNYFGFRVLVFFRARNPRTGTVTMAHYCNNNQHAFSRPAFLGQPYP